MPRLWYATTNKAKVLSLQRRLEPHGFEILQRPLSISEPRLDSVVDLALYKAMFAFQDIQEPVVTLDAGFFITSMGGFPGTFVNSMLATIGLEGLLRLVSGTDRRCEFRHALAFHDGGTGAPRVFVDRIPGHISPVPRGVLGPIHWSPLSTVFIPEGRHQTLTEMDPESYVSWRDEQSRDHRNYALQFLDWYQAHRPLP